jgi:asparagine synthase (glutamine-hydrolysing)
LVSQPKMGFSIPLGDWLRGPLRDWAEDLLSTASLEQGGHVDVAAVRDVWADHLAGRVNRPHQLWVILMLQAWLRAQA